MPMLMKREYTVPRTKTLEVEMDELMGELMGLSALNKNMDAQEVDPDDEEYDGEFGINDSFWDYNDYSQPKF